MAKKTKKNNKITCDSHTHTHTHRTVIGSLLCVCVCVRVYIDVYYINIIKSYISINPKWSRIFFLFSVTNCDQIYNHHHDHHSHNHHHHNQCHCHHMVVVHIEIEIEMNEWMNKIQFCIIICNFVFLLYYRISLNLFLFIYSLIC